MIFAFDFIDRQVKFGKNFSRLKMSLDLAIQSKI